MVLRMRHEDIMLEAHALKGTREVWKKFDPYVPCMCGSNKKWKFCCKFDKDKSPGWEKTYEQIKERLTLNRLNHKLKLFEG